MDIKWRVISMTDVKMPTFPLNIRALGSATRAYSTSILHIQLLLPLALLLQQR